MAAATDTFAAWLTQAGIAEDRPTPDQYGLLRAAFHFRQAQGTDAYSTPLLSQFRLHRGSGLKVAQLARLVGVSRPTASHQQGLSSKEAVREAHHRMDGRPYGQVLPRYAGPISEFLLGRPGASRADLIDFLDQTFGVRLSRIALYHFLKKFGIDQVPAATSPPEPTSPPAPAARHAAEPGPALPPAAAAAPRICSGARSTHAPS
jgi:hypothetical protein